MNNNEYGKIVYILGAGCSQEDKVPLINDFFDISIEIYNYLSHHQKKKFDNVFNFRNQYLPNSNIEELFSYLDLQRYLQASKNSSNATLESLRKDLIYLIAKTIERNIISNNSVNYKKFLDHHLSYIKKPIVITFNWELLLDNVIYNEIHNNDRNSYNIYGVDFKNVDENGIHRNLKKSKFQLLKLHGSLNWLHCRDCKDINKYFVHGKKSVLDILEGNPMQCPEDKRYLDPIMVPPSFQKINEDVGFSYLNDVWVEAENAIMNANKIIIIGYSFPEDDVHFKHFCRGALVKNYKKYKEIIKIDVLNNKKLIQEKLDFEKHYNDILSIPGVQIDLDFKYLKFSDIDRVPFG